MLSYANLRPRAGSSFDKTIPMPKVEGQIDHMAADVAGQRLFVAALGNNTVEVLDLKAGTTIQSLPGFAEPQGIAYVAELGRVFIANHYTAEQTIPTVTGAQTSPFVPELNYGSTITR